MLNVVICDDIESQRQTIKSIVENVIMIDDLDMKIILVTANPHDVIETVKNVKNTGLYFLDIQLNADINGIKLAEEIRKYDPRGFIVFISSFPEYQSFAIKYMVEALEFIEKFDFAHIRERIENSIRTANERFLAQTAVKHNVLMVKTKGKIISIEFKDIISIETSGTKGDHQLVLTTLNSRYMWSGALKAVEPRLDARFIRISQSFIVNMDYIREYSAKTRTLYLKNDAKFLVSLHKVNAITRLLLKRD